MILVRVSTRKTGKMVLLVGTLFALACIAPAVWAGGAPSSVDSGERIKQLLAGKAQSDSFGWFALRNFTYCLGGVAPDPLSSKLGMQSSQTQTPSGGSVAGAIAADSASDGQRMIGTGDSVVVLYHPRYKNKPIAWCNTLVAFSSTRHVSCHRALPTCQRCEAIPTNDENKAVERQNHQPSAGMNRVSPFHKRQSSTTAVSAEADTHTPHTALREFQDYCENKLTLAVRADCPLHIVEDWNDEPPFDLVRFCMASAADDGFTLNPALASKKPKGVIDPTDAIVPPSNS